MSCRKRYRLKSYGVVVEFLDEVLMDITVSNRVLDAGLGSGKSLWVCIHRKFDGCCYEVESEGYRVIRFEGLGDSHCSSSGGERQE